MYKRPLSEIKYIIIHHTVTSKEADVNQLRRAHTDLGWKDIGYHFIVRKGWLFTGRDRNYTGAHCLGRNRDGIGVAIVGTFHLTPPTDKELNDFAYQVKRLAQIFRVKLDREHIAPHDRYHATACPGGWMEKLYEKLGI